MEAAISMMETDLELDELQDNRFVINDDHKAEWALKRLRGLQAEHDRIVGECEKQIGEYEAIIERESKRHLAKASYLNALLSAYFETVPHDKTKTMEKYRLPSGDLVLKHPNPKIERDEETAVAHLRELGLAQYIKTKETVDWEALKPVVAFVDGECVNTETGEVIAGITAAERPAEFGVKLT